MLNHRSGLMAVVLACGLVIAACGSSGKPSAAASSDSGLQFSQCMRAHGVTNFPDPGAGGNFQFQISGSASPAFRSAQLACRKYAPVKAGPPRMTAGEQRAALRFAQCMRANGQPDFPDPSYTAPTGATRVLVLRGMEFALGAGVDPKSPAFRQAASRCGVTPPSGGQVPIAR